MDATTVAVDLAKDIFEVALANRKWPSDPAVAPGNRFAIVFDITPRPRIHVYAPGATSYRVNAVNLTPPPQKSL
jgi:hypothetical protein